MLRIADSGGPLMSKICGKMWRMMNSLESLPVTGFITIQRKRDIVEILRDRWMYFHSPAHAAAYSLDPEFRSELNEAPHEVIEDLQLILAQIYPNLEDQIEALNQFEQYELYNGVFGTLLTTKAAKQTFPLKWWSQFGNRTHCLHTLAKRLCSQTESKWSRTRTQNILVRQHSNKIVQFLIQAWKFAQIWINHSLLYIMPHSN